MQRVGFLPKALIYDIGKHIVLLNREQDSNAGVMSVELLLLF